MTDREAMQMALECLESLQGGCTDSADGTVEALTVWCPEVVEALRARLAEPEPEPVAFVNAVNLQGLTLGFYGYVEIYTEESAGRVPLYTAPPTRRPLTEEK